MNFAAAASHAPHTEDPTPDTSLLDTPDSSYNPDAKHVQVAQPEPQVAPKNVVPQKRESDQEGGEKSIPGGAATSKSQKKKKNKKKKGNNGDDQKQQEESEALKKEQEEREAREEEERKEKERAKERAQRKKDEEEQQKKEEAEQRHKEEEEAKKAEQEKQKKAADEQRKKENEEKEAKARAAEEKKQKEAKEAEDDKKAVEARKAEEEQKKNEKEANEKKKADEEEEKKRKSDDGKQVTSTDKSNGDVTKDEKTSKEDSKKPGSGFATELENHPSMQDRPAVPRDLADKLVDPYVARANIAASVESPNGTQANNWAEEHKHESVLQQHVAFFDRDNDGMIWPTDTFIGFHRLGYAAIWCLMAVFLIHPTFSYFTLDSWIPDPFFRISVKNIHRAKHGSDTGTYDSQGRFVPAKFESMFTKFDRGNKGGLTFVEGLGMIRENRNVLDPIGWIGAFFEWFASYLLIWPKNGIVSKEDLRTVYDGSLFYAVAEKESTTRSHLPWSGLLKENRAKDVNKLKSH